MAYERVELPEQPFIYVERECGFTGPEIAAAMGSAFGEVYTFVVQQGIKPVSMPASMYMEMPAEKLRFRGGFFVTAEDAAKVSGSILADRLPACTVLKTVHTGSYANLSAAHSAMQAHMEAEGMKSNGPIWEIYIDDPEAVPEADVRTEIYRTL